jgi:hypothetical protein
MPAIIAVDILNRQSEKPRTAEADERRLGRYSRMSPDAEGVVSTNEAITV